MRIIGWVVAGLLALGIAIAAARPSLDRFFRVKPKATEARTNLAAIRTTEFLYFEEHGFFVSASPTPPVIPGLERVPWPLRQEAPHGFNTLGWAPEGAVRCQYGVSADGAAFTAEVLCPHGDGVAAWGYVHPTPGQERGIPGPFGRCSTLGVHNVRKPESYLLDTVGPCDERSVPLR